MRKIFTFLLMPVTVLSILCAACGGAYALGPDMKTEAGIREYLAGEWNFVNTSDRDYRSCRMTIGKDLKAEFEFYGGKKARERVTGQFSFDRIYAGANEAPDLLRLELRDYKWKYGGAFLFLHRTVYDKRRVMSLFYAEQDESLFDDLLEPDPSNRYGIAPSEMVFINETGEEYDLAPRTNEEFYAVCWEYGKNRQEGVIWLDDIKWPPPHVYDNFDPIYSGERDYIYETTQYDNETPISAAYVMARDIKIEGGGELRQGVTYLVKTNGRGEITNMRRAVHVRPEDSFTVLTYAARGKYALEDITALIKAGADVKAKNHSDLRDVTVLMRVASSGSPEVINALIKAGADAKAKDNSGKMAIDHAKENEKIENTAALKELAARSR